MVILLLLPVLVEHSVVDSNCAVTDKAARSAARHPSPYNRSQQHGMYWERKSVHAGPLQVDPMSRRTATIVIVQGDKQYLSTVLRRYLVTRRIIASMQRTESESIVGNRQTLHWPQYTVLALVGVTPFNVIYSMNGNYYECYDGMDGSERVIWQHDSCEVTPYSVFPVGTQIPACDSALP
ncbi:hypothetical protein BU24DRAFT_404660 [Aaosphaeria arxii CBS 175.79]|uniref:Uncharacterized protein n=1 Tax=Aaosphaeria arxii CBS 175.79 TaxID=1450172 RepID=A0A6A5Y7W9_9PLEO|nr:uncharacterized protein BU24DRAFT_404660 [Aaosphaeria arxii CBS 175.79]KAF2021675.1 hypothetical protein BU24DRAFT_404660 [Aaosphaeria arxii CBS 175.79]